MEVMSRVASVAKKEKSDRNITPVLTLRLRRRFKSTPNRIHKGTQ